MADQLPDEAYSSAARLRVQLLSFQRRTEEITRRHGITPERYLLLLLIRSDSITGVRTTATSLCGPLRMTQSSVSRLVSGATRAGLVKRDLDPDDRRRAYLQLTSQGAARLAAAFQELGPERAALAAALAAHD